MNQDISKAKVFASNALHNAINVNIQLIDVLTVSQDSIEAYKLISNAFPVLIHAMIASAKQTVQRVP